MAFCLHFTSRAGSEGKGQMGYSSGRSGRVYVYVARSRGGGVREREEGLAYSSKSCSVRESKEGERVCASVRGPFHVYTRQGLKAKGADARARRRVPGSPRAWPARAPSSRARPTRAARRSSWATTAGLPPRMRTRKRGARAARRGRTGGPARRWLRARAGAGSASRVFTPSAKVRQSVARSGDRAEGGRGGRNGFEGDLTQLLSCQHRLSSGLSTMAALTMPGKRA